MNIANLGLVTELVAEFNKNKLMCENMENRGHVINVNYAGQELGDEERSECVKTLCEYYSAQVNRLQKELESLGVSFEPLDTTDSSAEPAE